jgi:putative molybdopterin biosynthesis protein
MPGIPAVLINISYRTQGFYIRKGNPKAIRGWEDLRRGDIRILNRRAGSSSRIILDMMLKKLGVSAARVCGYEKIMKSHLTMAAAIAAGEADVAIGTERISRQMEGIDFIPLQEERFDLVIRKEMFASPSVQTLLKILNSPEFQKEISHFSGNDYRDLGKIVGEI